MSSVSFASGSKGALVYAGRLLTPSGAPENSSNVVFTFQIVSPGGCLLWQETSSAVNMAGSSGAFSVSIGAGANSATGSLPWSQVFQNGVPLSGLSTTNCPGGTYTGAALDDRTMYVSFNDGTSTQTVGPLAVKATPQDSMLAGYPVFWNGTTPGAGSTGFGLSFNWNGGSPFWTPIAGGGAGVSSVAAAGTAGNPIVIGGTVSAPTVDITAASAGVNGYLKGSDWTTFNNKLSAVSATASLTNGKIWVGDGANKAQEVSLSSDATISNTGVLTLKNTGTAGTYGSATQVPVMTTDAQGRVTGVVNTTITGAAPTGAAGGDLSGTYPNPTIAKINNVLVNSAAVVGGVFMYDTATTTWKGKAFPTCTTAQSPYYNAVGDNIQCQTVAAAWASVTGKPTTVGGYGITDAITNAGVGAGNVITSIQSGNTAGRPAFGTDGRIYVDTQAAVIYRDSGAAWVAVTGAGGGGNALTGNPLSQFAATTSAQLAGVLSDETGTGFAVFSNSPTLVTPTLGAASATSINKVTLTAPATGSTLTIADGKTLTANNTLTFAGTDGSTLNIGAGGTLGTNAYSSTAYAPIASPTFTGTVTMPSPFTLGATSVTSTGAQLNYLNAATGTTGTTSSNLVFSGSPTIATPTFTTNITTPVIIGGTTTTSTLTYKTTTAAGAAGADHIFQVGNNGATEAMRILNNGNVGIGTNAPATPLDIEVPGTGTQLTVGPGSGSNNASINLVARSGGTAETVGILANQTASLQIAAPGHVGVGTGYFNPFTGAIFQIAGGTSIGGGYINTAAPGNGLIVQGSVGIGSSAPVSLLANTATNTADQAAIGINTAGGLTWLANGAGYVASFTNSGAAAQNNGVLVSTVSANAATNVLAVNVNGTDVMDVKGNGNVGIGTTSPSTRLEISSGTANVSGLKFTNFTSTAPTGTGQALGVDASGNLITISSGGGGNALTTNPLSQFAATTSAQLAGVLSDETGTGFAVFSNSPTLVTPTLGAASATSVNKVTITAPATGSTLTIADGKTLTANNTLTFAGTDGSTLNIGGGGTLGSNAYSSTAYAPIASPTFTGTVTMPSPFTLGATSVTSTGAQLNYLNAATGTTGTTSSNLVFSGSPTIATPTFTTNITTPVIIGGTTTTSTLTYKTTTAAGAAGADHIFQVGNNGATEAMRILNNGNVGIGTSSPGDNLTVAGAIGTNTMYLRAGATGNIIGLGTNNGTLNLTNSNGGNLANGITITGASGNVGIGTTTPGAPLDINGYSRVRTLNVTMPTVVNDETDIGSYSLPNGGTSLQVNVTLPAGSFSVAKEYNIPVQYGQTSGAWVIVAPISSSGSYGGNDFDLDINVNAGTTSLRIRRTAGSTAGVANVVIHEDGASSTSTFTPSVATSSVSAPTTMYSSAVLTQVNGRVGIGTMAPGAKLELSSGVANTSGLKFTNFTSAAPTGTGQAVGVDASGNLITIASGGGGSVTGVSSANADIAVSVASPNPQLTLNSGTTGGAGDANKIAKLDAGGLLKPAMIPNPAGDVTGTYSATTVSKIQNTAVSGVGLVNNNLLQNTSGATLTNQALIANGAGGVSGLAPGVGNFLRSNAGGTLWTSSGLAAADVTGALTYTPVNKAGDSMSGNLTMQTNTGVVLNNTANTFGFTVRAPSALASNLNWVLPSNNGANTNVLSTDGAGNLSWAAAGTGFSEDASLSLKAGTSALVNNTFNTQYNVAIGYQAEQYMRPNGGMGSNIAIGYQAMQGTTTPGNNTGHNNVAIGDSAMSALTSGSYNVGVGRLAMASTSTGTSNTAVGVGALSNNTSGGNNIAVGTSAVSNGSGSDNVGIGVQTMASGSGGSQNIAQGTDALYSTTTGNANVSTGHWSMAQNTTGSNNVAIGYQAGYTATPANANVTGNNNVFVGSNSGPGTSTQLTNAIAIGANAVVNSSNSMVLGDGTIKVGIGTTSPAAPLHAVVSNTGNGFYNMSPVLKLQNSNASGITGMTFLDSSNNAIGGIGVSTASTTAGDLLLNAGSAGTLNEIQLALAPSGNIGIGTATPAYKLSVAGTIQSTSGGFRFPDGTTQTTASTSAGAACGGQGHLTVWASGNFAVTGGYGCIYGPGSNTVYQCVNGSVVTVASWSYSMSICY